MPGTDHERLAYVTDTYQDITGETLVADSRFSRGEIEAAYRLCVRHNLDFCEQAEVFAETHRDNGAGVILTDFVAFCREVPA